LRRHPTSGKAAPSRDFSDGGIFSLFPIATESQLDEAHCVPVISAIRQVTLNEVAVNCDVRISALNGPACDRLRDLGFCEQMQLRKISNGRNLVCTVCGAKMAISRELAEQVLVSPIL
jgi:Fe2+ transport system protein FeoA